MTSQTGKCERCRSIISCEVEQETSPDGEWLCPACGHWNPKETMP